MQKQGKISVIIPTKDEAENMMPLALALHKALQQFDFDVIIIDDSASTVTVETAKKAYDHLGIPITVNHRKKSGKGSAIRDGFRYVSSSDYIAIIDADLQYPPRRIPEMLNLLIKKNLDIVNANRIRQDPPYRRILGMFFNLLLRLLFHLRWDTQAGLKVMRREVTESIDYVTDGWAWDVEFLVRAVQKGYSIDEYPVEFLQRKKGKTKINPLTSTLSMFFALLKIRQIL
ncbi:glycosyltransferase [Candidatus Borrarchaeum sp.]|uniref:glycosyltransferase n=1 Tax=Candidatus Borrarchaeum sp. TaxID=2846742 RepID=UPI00257D4B44|nr:glycosyltransferase [Candidatus Borrarchaeum sp.]